MTPKSNFATSLGGSTTLLAIALLITPSALATTDFQNPSGCYYDSTSGKVYHYTGILFDGLCGGDIGGGGSGGDPPACWTGNGVSQCGQCSYIPNDGTTLGDHKGWEKTIAQYQSAGSCANLDVDQAAGVNDWLRGDVRMVQHVGDAWHVTYVATYYSTSQVDPVWTKALLAPEYCNQDGQTASCSSGPHSINPTASAYAPPPGTSWNYYCVHVKVFQSDMINAAPVNDAWNCSNLVH